MCVRVPDLLCVRVRVRGGGGGERGVNRVVNGVVAGIREVNNLGTTFSIVCIEFSCGATVAA